MINVIIADDEPLALLELKTIIPWEKYGYHIIGQARNGRIALDMLKENPDIGLAILDINMPVLSGLEVIEEWRKHEGVTKFLVVSAYSDYALVRKAFKIGIKDYILKEDLEPKNLLPIIKKISGEINKEHAVDPRSSTPDILDRKQQLVELLNGDFLSLPLFTDLFSSKYRYRLIKLEILNCRETHKVIQTSSITYLSEKLIHKYFIDSMIIDYEDSFFLLISLKQDILKDINQIIITMNKELKNSIKKYFNITVCITGGLENLTLEMIKPVYIGLVGQHKSKSRSVMLSMNYIINNYQDPFLNMDSLCKITGTSRSHLSSQFKKETGLGYKEYLNEVRIGHAINLLEKTDIKVQEVCDKVGFSNVEHFSRTFKDRTGVSPSTFSYFSMDYV